MGDKTGIEWTDATWNPVRGCSRVSEGCRHCYAEQVAARFSGPGQPYESVADRSKPGSKWTGKVVLVETALQQPLRWRKPRRIFVNSMSDLFHESLSDEQIDRVFAVMALAPQHTFHILTKRPERMSGYLQDAIGRIADAIQPMRTDNRAVGPLPHLDGGERWWPLPNVWLGVSVEDQKAADSRIPLLLQTPAAKRFLSCEPLLGPVNLDQIAIPRGLVECNRGRLPAIDWVIAGGESGAGARPMHPDWARGLRDQCQAAGVPFFFKQWGQWLPWEPEHGPCWKAQNGRSEDHHALFPVDWDGDPNWDDGIWAIDGTVAQAAFQRVGKKAAGALLDGREHREFPA